MQALAGGEEGGLAGAELLCLHLMGFEIIPDVLTGPDLVGLLNADLAVGDGHSDLFVERCAVGGKHRVAVADHDAIGDYPNTGENAARQTLLRSVGARIQRPNIPFNLRWLLGAERERR